MLSTHMSPGKRKGCTVEAQYAMSMKHKNGRAAVAPEWTPWMVPWGVPRSCARVLDCHGPRGKVYEKPVLLCRRLCTVTQGLLGPVHRVCRAAPSVLSVWCRTAWCCALHCTVCALLHCTCW